MLTANSCFGQFIVPDEGLFTEHPFFDAEFLKHWKIKKITSDYQFKKDNDVIRERMKRKQYVFDRKGKLVSSNVQVHSKKGLQMTDIAYRYDRSQRLTAIRKSDPYGFHTVHFVWNNEGRMVKKFQTRTDFSQQNNQEKIVWRDSIECVEHKCVYYNDGNHAYKESIVLFNEQENCKSIITTYYRGNTTGYQKVWYNDDHFISAIEKKEGFPGSKTIRFEYAYDSKNRIEQEDYFENGEHIYTRKLSYTAMQGYPELNLIRYHQKKYIDIIQYTITFFE